MSAQTNENTGTRRYRPGEVFAFRYTTGAAGPLSNFCPMDNPANIAGIEVQTSEAIYQAAKFAGDPKTQRQILAAGTARDAARLGRAGRISTPDWNQTRINAMRFALRVKREANPELIDTLFELIGEQPIVEISTRDAFWGAKPTDEADGQWLTGANVLGRLWMELGEHVAHESPRAAARYWLDKFPAGILAEYADTGAGTAPNANTAAATAVIHTTGSIFDSNADAIVNPVNCVGVSGGGLAKQFAQRFPEATRQYEAACRDGILNPGHPWICDRGPQHSAPRFIIYFPTKDDWRNPSRREDIQDGLHNLIAQLATITGPTGKPAITSITFPLIGAGLGRLKASDTIADIETAFAGTTGLAIDIIRPPGQQERTP